MDDSALYTGVDGVEEGQFGNETVDDATKQALDEERRKIQELTPVLQDILAGIEDEIKNVMSIERFTTAAALQEDNIRAELQAAAIYKSYLDGLKTKFKLILGEVQK